MTDALFDLPPELASPDPVRPVRNEAKRSIDYVADAVLEFGKVGGVHELFDRVSRLCLTTKYKPYNCLLILLQRPAATVVKPAHKWEEQYGHVVRPGEQPIVLLQRGGPVMFLLDRAQVEPGRDARPLPAWMDNPYAMAEFVDARAAVHWIADNARYDGVRTTDSPLGIGFAGCVRRSRSGLTQNVLVRKRPRELHERRSILFDVELNSAYSPTEKLATLAHELGHVYCGHQGVGLDKHWDDRSRLRVEQAEHEAESVARVVFATLAPGVKLPDHLSQYFELGEPPLRGISLETVLKAAGRVLEIAHSWHPRWD